jgi:hypothetical protein
MADAGVDVTWTPVEEVADRVAEAVVAGTFWILPPSESADARIRARAASMTARTNPDYISDLIG